MPVHHCPVCGAPHDIHPVQHALAYGRALTCSPRCKQAFAELCRSRMLPPAHGGGAYFVPEHEVQKEPAC